MISHETKLMNLIIALQTRHRDGFPSVLFDNGYQLEAIEYPFNISDENSEPRQVKPELQLKSHEENHLLFIECKSGSIGEDQLKRYLQIKHEDILRSKITSLNTSKNISHDLAYVGIASNEAQLIKSCDIGNHFPILILKDDKLVTFQSPTGGNKFRSQRLNTAMTEVNVKNFPVSYIPFTPADNDKFITLAILREIQLYNIGRKEFTVEQIVTGCYKERSEFLSTDQLNQLKGLVGRLLKDLKDSQLSEHLILTGNTWKLNTKTSRSFQSACQKVIDELSKAEDRNSKQTSLFSHFNGEK